MTLKNNRAPLLSNIKLHVSFHYHLWIQTGVTAWERLKNWASEAHILHTFKSICNEHVKQYCCETSENFLRKWPNTRNLTNFGAQKRPTNWDFAAHIFHISENSSNKHIKQDWCESRANFLTKYSKTCILTHLEAQNLGLWGLSFTQLQKLLQWACKSSFKWIWQKHFKKIDVNL